MKLTHSQHWLRDIREEYQANLDSAEMGPNMSLHREILARWKLESPIMWRRLEMAGNTEKLAFVQQERMWKAADEYMATGMQYTTAMKMARMDHLMMEPESEVMYKEQG